MLIDWISLKVSTEFFKLEELRALEATCDQVCRYQPETGNVQWITSAWDSIRSDTHQISFKVGASELYLQGSPARIYADGCSVFGAGVVSGLDLAKSSLEMIGYFSRMKNLKLPQLHHWSVTRVDVTQNLMFSNLDEVRSALSLLRDCEGGRYRVSQKAGDTVYWNHKSRLRKGKAYAKGAHLEWEQKKRNYTGITRNEAEIEAAKKLLRLELTLGREYWRRLNYEWHETTPKHLRIEWHSYFDRMIGDIEMTTDSKLEQKLIELAPTRGQAMSALKTWHTIDKIGWEKTRTLTADRTWYRHLKLFRQAGLGDADISRGEIVPIRKKILEAKHVNTWPELLRAS